MGVPRLAFFARRENSGFSAALPNGLVPPHNPTLPAALVREKNPALRTQELFGRNLERRTFLTSSSAVPLPGYFSRSIR